MEYNHIPVLYDEVIKGLNIKRTEYILTARLGAEGMRLAYLKDWTKADLSHATRTKTPLTTLWKD